MLSGLSLTLLHLLLLLALEPIQDCVANERETFFNHRLYRLRPLSPSAVVRLVRMHRELPSEPNPRLGVTFFNFPGRVNSTLQVLVPPQTLAKFKRRIAGDLELQVELLSRNFARALEASERANAQGRRRRRRSVEGLLLTHSHYREFDEILDALQRLNARCNALMDGSCRLQEIGRSHEKRPITVLRIAKTSSEGRQRPKVWIDGGIHAREWISPATVLLLADTLISKGLAGDYFKSEAISNLLDSYEFMILVMYNPDGYQFSHLQYRMWRKNREPVGMDESNRQCHGVDLNRNYGFMWGGRGSSEKPCLDNFRGAAAFSAAETRAVKEFVEAEHSAGKFLLFLSFHSFGQYILMPYGYRRHQYSEPKQLADKLKCAAHFLSREMFSRNHRFYIYGTSADVLYEASGGSDDWAHGQIGIPYSLTVELPDDGPYGFLLPPAYIENVGQESVFGLVKLMRTISGIETNEKFAESICSAEHS